MSSFVSFRFWKGLFLLFQGWFVAWFWVLCGFGNLNGLGIGGLVDMKPICGIIVARRKVRAGKEGKVSPIKMKIYRYVRQYFVHHIYALLDVPLTAIFLHHTCDRIYAILDAPPCFRGIQSYVQCRISMLVVYTMSHILISP